MDKRSKRIASVIRKYKAIGDANEEGAIRDILTDIIHLCDKQLFAFDMIVKSAKNVYNEERCSPKTLKCPACGGTEFYATQACRGSLTVIASVGENGTAFFERNTGGEDAIDPNELDFDTPEGPFACIRCGKSGMEVNNLKK